MLRNITSKTLQLGKGLLEGRRDSLAKAITLIESTNRNHNKQAQYLLEYISNNRHNSKYNINNIRDYSLRVGIAGPPGAGKSTFIEQMGLRYLAKNHRVAVIPVDPSSHVSGGSLLGDKTRMEGLSRSPDAYVRASPTRGVLGGIAEHTVDVITLCEAAGYDTVIVESVGLGQSEVDIESAVDMMILIVPPGGGDSLQATKKGIMEAADLIAINKADGPLLTAARHTKADYSGAMHFIRPKYPDWTPKVILISAYERKNLDKIENEITNFHNYLIETKQLHNKRVKQSKLWAISHFQRILCTEMGINDDNNYDSNSYNNSNNNSNISNETRLMRNNISNVLKLIDNNSITHRAAAEKLLDHISFNITPIDIHNNNNTHDNSSSTTTDGADAP